MSKMLLTIPVWQFSDTVYNFVIAAPMAKL